ncbi:ABC transporter permease, partial [archaeon]|nr:ABC transporter permease [archaeon]
AEGTGQGPPGSGVVDPLTDSDLRAIERVGGVEFALGRVVASGMVEYNNQISFNFIGSFPEGTNADKINTLINLEADEGRLMKKSDIGVVTVGSDFKESDLFGKPVLVGARIKINEETFKVVGILKKKGSFITDGTVMMSEAEMRTLFGEEDNTFDAIAVKVKSGVEISDVKDDIEKTLRSERDVKKGFEDFTVQTNNGALESLKSTLFGVQLFVYIIAGISIVVGGIGIMNTMYTSVLERKREIGIMKAIGAKNRNIFTLFFIESGLLGIVGGIIGIILGVIIAKGLAFAGQQLLNTDLINASISPWLLIGALAFSFIVGTISGLMPAVQASKLNPIDALSD